MSLAAKKTAYKPYVPDFLTLCERNYAQLRFLLPGSHAAAKANIGDFDPVTKTLRIFGKGRGNNSETVSLGSGTVMAIESWLSARGERDPDKALFCSVNPGYRDGRLSTQFQLILNPTRD